MSFLNYIAINPEIRFGKPCIIGTRISVYDVLAWLASGMKEEEIIEEEATPAIPLSKSKLVESDELNLSPEEEAELLNLQLIDQEEKKIEEPISNTEEIPLDINTPLTEEKKTSEIDFVVEAPKKEEIPATE